MDDANLIWGKAVSTNRIGVILPAGGKGLRVGGAVPKQFVSLGDEAQEAGRPMLLYALETFHRLKYVIQITLVLPKDRLSAFAYLPALFQKLILVEGGAERFESVHNGFRALDPTLDTILVHDIARPFVSEQIIERCLQALVPNTCVIAALPIADTVKEVAGELIVKTLDRRRLIQVQTPQVFPRELMEKIYSENWTGDIPTDEAQMAERFGYAVHWVLGAESNRKVTGAEDLEWAAWMARRK